MSDAQTFVALLDHIDAECHECLVVLKGQITERGQNGDVLVQWVKWKHDDLCKCNHERVKASRLVWLTPELEAMLDRYDAILNDPWGLDPFETERDAILESIRVIFQTPINASKNDSSTD